MYTQTVRSPLPADPMGRLAAGEARRLGGAGELTVVAGAVWLTRRGDLGDHVLGAGERVRLGAAEDAVIEAWSTTDAAVVRWQPWHAGFVAALLAEPLGGVAFLARRLALACAVVARGAARAQGRRTGLSA